MAIGLQLKALRNNAGITQKQLSEETGIPLQSLINYENGRRDPNSKALSALEKHFGVSGTYLRGETDKPLHSYAENWAANPEISIDHTHISKICSAITTAAENCNEFEQKMICDILVELRHILNMNNKQFGANEADARAVTLGLLQKMIWYLNSYSDRVIAAGITLDSNRIDGIIFDTIERVKASLEKAVSLNYPSAMSDDEMFGQDKATIHCNTNSDTEKTSMSPFALVARGGFTQQGMMSDAIAEELSNLPQSLPGEDPL